MGAAAHMPTTSDAEQWQFLVVPEKLLPTGQMTIGLAKLETIATPCGIADFRHVIEGARRELTMCKAAQENPIDPSRGSNWKISSSVERAS